MNNPAAKLQRQFNQNPILIHQGVIFGIKWNKEGCGLISFSDDRSLRVWELPDRQAELPTTTYVLSSEFVRTFIS